MEKQNRLLLFFSVFQSVISISTFSIQALAVALGIATRQPSSGWFGSTDVSRKTNQAVFEEGDELYEETLHSASVPFVHGHGRVCAATAHQ
jgi:hypothetical protein